VPPFGGESPSLCQIGRDQRRVGPIPTRRSAPGTGSTS
jgi:hypothetical protein